MRPPKTTAQYEAELDSLGINVFPLEDYKGALVSISHRCVCGREWRTTPNRVLRGGRCKNCASNMMRASSAAVAKIDAEAKKKKIIRLGPYVQARELCKFKCLVCETTWYTRPARILEHGCKPCSVRNAKSAFYSTNKQVRVGSRTVSLQGYEEFAVRELLCEYEPKHIRFGKEVPIIKLPNGKNHYPDMWIPSENTLVEVKSTFTLGLHYRSRFLEVQAKALAAIAQGYKYKLMLVFQDKEIWTLPKTWTHWSYSEFYERMP